jgi:hypothetical protein
MFVLFNVCLTKFGTSCVSLSSAYVCAAPTTYSIHSLSIASLFFKIYYFNSYGSNNQKGIFVYALTRIDFDRIDYVKLILVKIDFKLKWFIFGYINAKVS